MAKAVELAASLAKLAEHYRTLGDTEIHGFNLFNYCIGKAEFVSNVFALPKPVRKEVDDSEYRVIYEAPGITMQVYAARDRVCTVVVPAVPAVYECEPLLSLNDEAALGDDTLYRTAAELLADKEV